MTDNNLDSSDRTKRKAQSMIAKGIEAMEKQEQGDHEIIILLPEDTIKKLKDLHQVFGLSVGVLIYSAINYLEFYLATHDNLTIETIMQYLELNPTDKINNSKPIKKQFHLTWLTKHNLEKIDMLDHISESIIIGTELMYRYNYLTHLYNRIEVKDRWYDTRLEDALNYLRSAETREIAKDYLKEHFPFKTDLLELAQYLKIYPKGKRCLRAYSLNNRKSELIDAITYSSFIK